MEELKKALKSNPVIYVTRDLERAIGLPQMYKNYYIITNSSTFARQYSKTHKNILLIKEKETLDTRELLEHKKTLAFFKKLKSFSVLVFKNTSQIEKICTDHQWRLLNPSATLASKVEEKISQLEWLGELKKYLPPHQVLLCRDLTWPLVIPTDPPAGGERRNRLTVESERSRDSSTTLRFAQNDKCEKYIVQFNRAHTGSGTILIESEKQLKELRQKFPNRDVRVSIFVDGPAFTNNNLVWAKKVFMGNINYQITGLPPFTTRPFATIGNDWSLPHKMLSKKQIKQYEKIATDVGKKLAKDGWKGLFGIDVMMDEKTGKLYLIEINARQPASTTFESQLQQSVISSERGTSDEKSSSQKISTFEAHIASLFVLQTTSYQLQAITDGAQVVAKVKEPRISNLELKKKTKKLKDLKINVIPYDNTEEEQDLLRIQSKRGVMEDHNKFNKLGSNIKAILL